MNVENNGPTLVTMIQLGKILYFFFHLIEPPAGKRDIVDIE